jgi:hypothetical protein
MKIQILFTLFLMVLGLSHAQAGVSVSNGTVTINISGDDADSWGGDASSAGNANVVLAYADVITIPASKMFSYMQQFRGPWVPQNAVDLLNKLVSPSAPRGPWSFKSCFAAP